jgi:flagellar basal-body rod protein FlgG
MLEGLYSAGAGMEAAQTQLDSVANNMANENTTGYQAEQTGFQDLLYTTDNDDPSTAIVGSGASAQTIGFSQSQGSLQQTGNPLDVAIEGSGYLQVRQADGQTTTSLGMEMVPPITLPKGTVASDVSIASDGTVSAAGTKVGKLQIVQVPAPDKLLPQGSSVYSVTTASGATAVAKGSTLQQGALEASNVNLDTEITTMETAQQAYDMGSKAVQMEAQLGQIAATLK